MFCDKGRMVIQVSYHPVAYLAWWVMALNGIDRQVFQVFLAQQLSYWLDQAFSVELDASPAVSE